MTIEELLIKLGVDASGFKSGMATATSETKKMEEGVTQSTSKIGKNFDDAAGHGSKFGGIMSGIGAGIGMAAFNMAAQGISKVIDVLGDSEKAYQDAAVSTAQMSTALKNNVPAAQDNVDAINKVIDANLKYGFSADDQRQSLALLVGVTHDVGQAQGDMSEAMDLARLKGIDLASATNIIIKAQEGNTGALKKLGIEVAPVTTAMDALKASNVKATQAQIDAATAADKQATETAALAAVQKLAGGQAEAYADTSAGKLAAAHQKVTEAMVKLGGIIDKIVQAVLPPLADAFNNIMDAVGPLLDQLGNDMPGILATVSGAVQALWSVLQPIADFLSSTLPGAISTAQRAFASLTAMFKGGSAQGGQLGNDMKQLQSTFSAVFNDIQSIVQSVLGFIKSFWKTWGDDITAYVKVIVQFWSETFGNVLKVIQGIFDVFAALFKGDWQGVWNGIQEIFSGVWDQIGTIFKAALGIFPILLDAAGKVLGAAWSAIWDGISAALKAAWDGMVALIKWYLGLPGQMIDAAGKVISTAWGAIWDGLKTGLGVIWDGIIAVIKAPINVIITMIDTLIGALDAIQLHMNFSVPNPLGGTLASVNFNWNGFGIGKIPTLHSGGIVPGPAGADVLTMLQAGEGVISASNMQRGMGKSVTNKVTVNNPVPETASSSVQRTLLTLGATGHM